MRRRNSWYRSITAWISSWGWGLGLEVIQGGYPGTDEPWVRTLRRAFLPAGRRHTPDSPAVRSAAVGRCEDLVAPTTLFDTNRRDSLAASALGESRVSAVVSTAISEFGQ